VRAERRAAGITLLEVLVALLVLAIALLALVRTTATQVDQFAVVRERALAGWLAQDLLAETRLASAFPATGSSSGSRRFAARDWRWQVRIEGTQAPTVRRIEVIVSSAAERDVPLARLTGFAGEDLLR
jgi:general secretion pathway protein I